MRCEDDQSAGGGPGPTASGRRLDNRRTSLGRRTMPTEWLTSRGPPRPGARANGKVNAMRRQARHIRIEGAHPSAQVARLRPGLVEFHAGGVRHAFRVLESEAWPAPLCPHDLLLRFVPDRRGCPQVPQGTAVDAGSPCREVVRGETRDQDPRALRGWSVRPLVAVGINTLGGMGVGRLARNPRTLPAASGRHGQGVSG